MWPVREEENQECRILEAKWTKCFLEEEGSADGLCRSGEIGTEIDHWIQQCEGN